MTRAALMSLLALSALASGGAAEVMPVPRGNSRAPERIPPRRNGALPIPLPDHPRHTEHARLATPSLPVKGKRKASRAERKRARLPR
jgi:hypothetical protein